MFIFRLDIVSSKTIWPLSMLKRLSAFMIRFVEKEAETLMKGLIMSEKQSKLGGLPTKEQMPKSVESRRKKKINERR